MSILWSAYRRVVDVINLYLRALRPCAPGPFSLHEQRQIRRERIWTRGFPARPLGRGPGRSESQGTCRGSATHNYHLLHRLRADRRSTTLLTIATALNLLIAPTAHALKSDATQPIHINARSVEVNEKTGVAIYRGAVRLRQGTLRLDADHVEVTSRNQTIQTIRARGNPVKVHTQTDKNEAINAEAKRADYFATKRQLDLYDDVVVKRNDDVLRGAIVRYNLDTRAMSAEGNDAGQVWSVIQPAAKTP